MGAAFDGLISIAIPTIERDDHVRRLLASLFAAASPGRFEILVADQANDDREGSVLAGFERSSIRWFRSPRGKSPALNHALREAKGDVFACLDDDVTVLPDWFTLLRRFAGDEPFETLWGSVRRGPPPDRDAFVSYTGDGPPACYQGMARGGVMQGMGANVAFRTSALRALGGFDEAFGPGCPFPAAEDRDLASRAARAGYWTRFEPDWGVLHWSTRSRARGEVQALMQNYFRGDGALWMKGLRLGDWGSCGKQLRFLLRPRAWLGRGAAAKNYRSRARAFLRGAFDALKLPVDAETRMFRPAAAFAIEPATKPFAGLITVAIPTIERDDFLHNLLSSLLAAEAPGPFEIVVADQSRDDRAARILSGLDATSVRWLRSPPGKTAGLNHALREARGDVFACIDDDATIPADWFTTLRRLAGEEPFDVLWGSVAPGWRPSADEWLPALEGLSPAQFKGLARDGRMPGSGTIVAYRTEALRAMGGFDEALSPGGICDNADDRDIASRAAHAGLWSRVAPEFEVLHWNARRYSDGSAQALDRMYQRGLGAFWMKQLRLGDWPIVWLHGRSLLWVRPWRHRRHRARVRAFLGGAWTAARLPLDREARLLKPPAR